MVHIREFKHLISLTPTVAKCCVKPFRLLVLRQMKFDSVMAEILIAKIPVAEVTNVEESRRPPHTGVDGFADVMILKAIFHPQAA